MAATMLWQISAVLLHSICEVVILRVHCCRLGSRCVELFETWHVSCHCPQALSHHQLQTAWAQRVTSPIVYPAWASMEVNLVSFSVPWNTSLKRGNFGKQNNPHPSPSPKPLSLRFPDIFACVHVVGKICSQLKPVFNLQL